MSSLIPIYYQIKQTIRDWIINKEFNPGDKIPSENELAEKFSVSRLTVRQAISQLAQEGFLLSRRGEGTFVTNNQTLIDSFGLEFGGFMDDLFHQVSQVKTRSVNIKKIIAPKLVNEKLELKEQNEEVILIKRIRLLNNKIFSYTINYLPMNIGLKIDERELYKKPLLRIMEENLGIHFVEAFQPGASIRYCAVPFPKLACVPDPSLRALLRFGFPVWKHAGCAE